MFNKKIMVLLIFLLFILHVSFVSANDCNETNTIIEINDYHNLTVNNDNSNNGFDCLYEPDDFHAENSLEFNEGDKIPITVDSPVEGNLTVLIDNEIYGIWNFSKNETIYIPTYNSDSFYNPSIKNINVGTHKISLIFNLNTVNNYIPIVSKDSNLFFQFHTYNNEIINKNYTYTYNSTLTINKKEKTIHIDYAQSFYFSTLGVDFILDNVKWENIVDLVYNGEYNGKLVGIIFSENNKILLKEIITITKAFLDFDEGTIYEGTVYDDDENITHYYFNFDVPGITEDVVCKHDNCKVTVVNLEDGTYDTVFIDVLKFAFSYVEYTVNEADVTFFFYNWYSPVAYISVDDRDVVINSKNATWNITFPNFNPGVHVMTIYSPGTDFVEEIFFTLNFTTVAFPKRDVFSKNDNLDHVIDVNMSFKMFENMKVTVSPFLFSVNNIIPFQYWSLIFNSTSSSNEFKLGSKSGNGGASISVGDTIGDGFSDGSANVKSYEVSKKSVSESKDNLLTKLCLTLISCMSFIGGYVRFEKNK